MPITTRKSATPTKLHNAALDYARHDIPVFPLRPRDKKPLTEHGFKAATTDIAQVEAWWKQHPNANIGVPMGAATRRLLLDLDYRNGSVIESRADLIERYGAIPDTCEVKTGSGGRHIHFRYAGGAVPKQIDKGVELKGDGGYAVVPPSIHPNGKPYTFDCERGWGAMLNPADPPQWLLEAIANQRPGRSAVAAPADKDRWPEGERNNRVTSLGGKLRHDGLSVSAIEAALLEENRLRCSPPLPDDEVKGIARSVGRYAPRAASVNLDALSPSIEMLNALAIFGGKIQFASVKSRGRMILASFVGGGEAIWDSTKELISFSASQHILADATRIVIPAPSRKAQRAVWEPIAQLILRLAGADRIISAEVLRDEFSQILYAVWKRAKCPVANNDDEFFELLQECVKHKREPHSGPPRCAVWHNNRTCYVHQPTLVEWLSTPGAKHKQYDWGAVQKALLLLEFKPDQVHRSYKGEHAKVRLWFGSLDALIDDETPES